MKRVLSIVLLALIVFIRLTAQVTSVGGELRYEHEYQDLLFDRQLSTNLRSNPIMNLGIAGVIYSPVICELTLHTSLNLNYGTSHLGDLTLNNHQSYWKAYDASFDFFKYSPVKFQLSARDHLVENRLEYDGLSNFSGRNRSQEQRARLAVDKIPFLPSINIFYVQNRSWALTGDPSEQLTHQLSFSVASSSGPGSSANLSGSFTDVNERYTGFQDKNSYLQFTGTKEISSGHRVDIVADYYRYSLYGSLTGSLGYTGLLSNKVRIATNLSGTQSNTAFTTYRSVGTSQSINIASGDYYRFALSLNEMAGKFSSIASGRSSYNGLFGSTASAQHNRTLGTLILTNGLSVGFSSRDYGEVYRIWEGSFSNGISTSIGSYSVSGNYDFSAQSTRNRVSWYSFGNNANVNVSGNISGNIHERSSLLFHSDIYGGDFRFSRNQRSLTLTQGFDGQFFYYMPFSLGLGGSSSWYSSSPTNHTYGWFASFTSSNFFLRGLYATYRYSRNFDPYYGREIIEQNGSCDYQWRALVLHLLVHQTSVPYRIRDITFSISRPF